jgi:hypothetical protein
MREAKFVDRQGKMDTYSCTSYLLYISFCTHQLKGDPHIMFTSCVCHSQCVDTEYESTNNKTTALYKATAHSLISLERTGENWLNWHWQASLPTLPSRPVIDYMHKNRLRISWCNAKHYYNNRSFRVASCNSHHLHSLPHKIPRI